MSSSPNEEIRVSIESMPRSLAFMNKGDAIDAADYLAAFLAVSADAIAIATDEDCGLVGCRGYELWRVGQTLAFALLRDLVEIGAGRSPMPLVGSWNDKGLPDLADVIAAGADALKKI